MVLVLKYFAHRLRLLSCQEVQDIGEYLCKCADLPPNPRPSADRLGVRFRRAPRLGSNGSLKVPRLPVIVGSKFPVSAAMRGALCVSENTWLFIRPSNVFGSGEPLKNLAAPNEEDGEADALEALFRYESSVELRKDLVGVG